MYRKIIVDIIKRFPNNYVVPMSYWGIVADKIEEYALNQKLDISSMTDDNLFKCCINALDFKNIYVEIYRQPKHNNSTKLTENSTRIGSYYLQVYYDSLIRDVTFHIHSKLSFLKTMDDYINVAHYSSDINRSSNKINPILCNNTVESYFPFGLLLLLPQGNYPLQHHNLSSRKDHYYTINP